MKKRVLTVFGTRPEAIKMAPVVKALQENKDSLEPIICVTGQHRDILDQMLAFFEITPDIDLNLMSPNQTLADLTAKTVQQISAVITETKPDITLVQGDTTTAMAAGLASFYQKVNVGHVEAGLRTDHIYNPFPEEVNRRILSTFASHHFTPTASASIRLEQEGVAADTIHLTGNTVIDALLWAAPRVKRDILREELAGRRYLLVTAHRRENFGGPIEEICTALKTIVADHDIDIVYPVHPNPNIQRPVHNLLNGVRGIHLVPPLQYKDFIAFMKDAELILSDSGGVQEEAPSLGKPVLVLRDTTERPEAVEAGVAQLVGTGVESIRENVHRLLTDKNAYREMANRTNPFGDGTAAQQIVALLKR